MTQELLILGLGLFIAAVSIPRGKSIKSPDTIVQKVAIPSYIYPCASSRDCFWDQLFSGIPTVSVVIINPNSGPWATMDPKYRDQVSAAKARDIKVLGYVSTKYASRPLSTVVDEIERYYKWYEVSGIFLDEVSSGCEARDYYARLYTFTKSKGKKEHGIVALNPGTNTDECYFIEPTGDILLLSKALTTAI